MEEILICLNGVNDRTIQAVISHMGPASHVNPKMLVPSLFSRLPTIRQVPYLSFLCHCSFFSNIPQTLPTLKIFKGIFFLSVCWGNSFPYVHQMPFLISPKSSFGVLMPPPSLLETLVHLLHDWWVQGSNEFALALGTSGEQVCASPSHTAPARRCCVSI